MSWRIYHRLILHFKTVQEFWVMGDFCHILPARIGVMTLASLLELLSISVEKQYIYSLLLLLLMLIHNCNKLLNHPTDVWKKRSTKLIIFIVGCLGIFLCGCFFSPPSPLYLGVLVDMPMSPNIVS